MKKWLAAALLPAIAACGGGSDEGVGATEAALAGNAHVRVRMEVTVNMTRHNSSTQLNWGINDTDVVTMMGVVPNTNYAAALNCMFVQGVYVDARPGSSEFGQTFRNCADSALGPVLDGTANQLMAMPMQVPYNHPLSVGFRVDDTDTAPVQDLKYQEAQQAGQMLQTGGTAVAVLGGDAGAVIGGLMQVAGGVISASVANHTASCAGGLLPDPGFFIASFDAGAVLLADGGTPQSQEWDFTGPSSPPVCGPFRSQTHVKIILEHDPNDGPAMHQEPSWSTVWGLPGDARRIGATPDGTGQLRLVAEGANDQPYSARGTSTRWFEPWQGPTLGGGAGLTTMLNGHLAGSPQLAVDRNGNVNAFLFTNDGAIGVATQMNAAADTWGATSYWPVPQRRSFLRFYASPFVTPPGVGQRPDGGLEIFATNADGNVYINYQTGDLTWSGWQTFGAPTPLASGQPTVNVNVGGGLEVYVLAKDGTIWGRAKPTQYGAWGDWFTMGGSSMFDPVLARNWDGRLEIFTVSTSHQLCHKWQTSASTWSGPNWSCDLGDGHGGYCTSKPAVTNSADGSLEVFVRGGEGALWHVYETFDARYWSPWQNLGGNVDVTYGPDAIVATNNANASIEVFFRNASDGTLNAVWQIQ